MSAKNDPRLNARLSVRRGLPGMMDIGKSAATGIQATMGLKAMIAKASQDVSALKITIQSLTLVGKIISPKTKDWTVTMDSLQHEVGDREPAYIALWKARRQCILISFVPEDIKPKEKMMYSGTRAAVKDAILEIDDGCNLEEFNVNEKEEISYERYAKKGATPKPYTEQELLRQEHDTAETAGGYGFLAHLAKMQAAEGGKGSSPMPVALPGLADLKKPMPSRLSKLPVGFKTDKEVNDEINELKRTEKKAKPVALPGMAMGMALPGLAKAKPQKKVEVEAEEAEEEEEEEEVETEVEESDDDVPPEPIEIESENEEEDVTSASEHEDAEIESEPARDEPEEDDEMEEEKAPAKSRRRGPPKFNEPVKESEPAIKPKPAIPRKRSFNKVMSFLGFGKSKVEEKPTFTEEELKQYSNDDGIATYMELLQCKKKKDYGVYDPRLLETYLSSREFFTVFEMSKETFATLPAWKRNKLKKNAKLF